MKRLDLHAEIEPDLDKIWDWLAFDQKAPEAADRVRDAIQDSFYLLAQHPQIGVLRWKTYTELRDVRMLVVS